MFQEYVSHQLNRVRRCPQAEMLGQKAYDKLEKALNRLTRLITQSTARQLIGKEAAAVNPIAAELPGLLTEEERKTAVEAIKKKIDSGELVLPKPLLDTLTAQLSLATEAFLEMLSRVTENRDAICAALTDGKPYTRIEDIDLSAGDTHNGGRTVAVLHTDAGKLVYKPHDLRGDAWIHDFAQRFFPEFVGVPRSVAFGDRFGVCEFIEKRCAEGEEEAERFWYALGGLTAFIKLMGGTDMHCDNLMARGEKTCIIDLETVFTPISSEQTANERYTESLQYVLRSPAYSLIMPGRLREYELSVLMNVDTNGSAPIVNGERVTVRRYLPQYKQGYRDAYDRAVQRREEIREAVSALPPRLPIRIVPRPTQTYYDVLVKLYHYSALASQEDMDRNTALLRQILSTGWKTVDPCVIESEIRQMRRGDVPYFYTFTDSRSLYGGGKELVRNRFSTTAVERVLDTLSALGKEDEEFDLAYIDRAISMYPEKWTGDAWKKETHADAERRIPLSRETAAREAARILKEMYALRMPLPNGKPIWGSVSHGDYGLAFSDHSLYNGYTGIAVFAAACASTLGGERTQVIADILTEEAANAIHGLCQRLQSSLNPDHAAPLGEGGGLDSALLGLSLLRRYAPSDTLDALTREVLEVLGQTNFAACREPDRVGGAAGLISTLCRFEEYRGCKEIVRKAADRLLELKTFEYKGDTLWKTLPDTPRPLSGAGHGMAGIAEALFQAAYLLNDEKYLPAAREALDFERRVFERYGKKFDGWADLRDFPPKSSMNGNCSGAPGIGILMKKIIKTGLGGETAETMVRWVRESVDKRSLNACDHLCCGNAAVAEYYLSHGDPDAASGVLGAMYERRQAEGAYRYTGYYANNSVNASLFYGMSGIGYEMLRYAFPDKIISIL